MIAPLEVTKTLLHQFRIPLVAMMEQTEARMMVPQELKMMELMEPRSMTPLLFQTTQFPSPPENICQGSIIFLSEIKQKFKPILYVFPYFIPVF